jgi:aminoglycoside phosphotransferase family enzyme
MRRAAGPEGPGEAEKVAFLARPESHAHRPDSVKVVETHMSWVFLAGPRVLKMKKPVSTRFLDFATLERRREAVAEELRLNRRLAPGVYLGARALRLGPEGGLTLGDGGQVVDWLVEMRRLPEEHTLRALVEAGRAGPADVDAVAGMLVEFYRSQPAAATTPERYAERFQREHRETARVLEDPAFGLDGKRVAGAFAAFEAAYAEVRPLLEARVRAGRIVEGHGDLRPEHVFLTEPPVAIDCLEFNEGLRTVDPFDEIAFLGLECARHGADWVYPELRDRLEAGLDDRPETALLAFYWRYRSLLRARLALLHLTEPRVRRPEKWRPLAGRYLDYAAMAEARVAARA